MKDWETRLTELDTRLVEWRSRYDAEFERLRRERGKGFFKRLSEDQVSEVARLAQSAAGEDVLADVAGFFDELTDFYATALPGVRAKIRAVCGFHYEVFSFLWQYAEESAQGIEGSDAEVFLRRGLLAVSIDDHRVETSLFLDLLGRFWIAAVRAGIDPRSTWAGVTEVSSPSSAGGAGRTQSWLLEFEGSNHFRDHVAPQLKNAS